MRVSILNLGRIKSRSRHPCLHKKQQLTTQNLLKYKIVKENKNIIGIVSHYIKILKIKNKLFFSKIKEQNRNQI